MDEVLKRLVWQRAGGKCEYCQLLQEWVPDPFQIDHVIAVQHSGPTRTGNLALACRDCNLHKGPNLAGFDPLSRRVIPLFNPRRHAWRRHFQWEGTALIGLTPVGRVTVAVLAINLPYRIEYREMLMASGLCLPDS